MEKLKVVEIDGHKIFSLPKIYEGDCLKSIPIMRGDRGLKQLPPDPTFEEFIRWAKSGEASRGEINNIFRRNVLLWLPRDYYFHDGHACWAKYENAQMSIWVQPQSDDGQRLFCCIVAEMFVYRLLGLDEILRSVGLPTLVVKRGYSVHFLVPFDGAKFEQKLLGCALELIYTP